jgi:dipeptide/tripeptide permease
VSNSGFVYPIVFILFGFFIYNMIWFYDYHKEQGGRDPHLIASFAFMLSSFAVGFLVMIAPRLFLES